MRGADPPAAAEGPLLFAQVFRARPPAIRAVLLAVEGRLAPISPDLANRVELVLAELLNNIQRHGHRSRPARVALRLFWQVPGLRAELIDDGGAIPAACLTAPLPPPPRSLPENGFGWPLIHGLVSDLRYRRGEGYNVLGFRVPW